MLVTPNQIFIKANASAVASIKCDLAYKVSYYILFPLLILSVKLSLNVSLE